MPVGIDMLKFYITKKMEMAFIQYHVSKQKTIEE